MWAGDLTGPAIRPLTEHLNLAAILSHVGERVIGNDYTVSFADGRYHILRSEVQAGMRRQRLRFELRLNGELKTCYQRRYVEIQGCGARPIVVQADKSKPGIAKITTREVEANECRAPRSSESATVKVDRRLRT
jgi:hypothetical protein